MANKSNEVFTMKIQCISKQEANYGIKPSTEMVVF